MRTKSQFPHRCLLNKDKFVVLQKKFCHVIYILFIEKWLSISSAIFDFLNDILNAISHLIISFCTGAE